MKRIRPACRRTASGRRERTRGRPARRRAPRAPESRGGSSARGSRLGRSGFPLEDAEGAEARRVGERLGLVDAAAAGDRVERGGRAPGAPAGGALLDELVEAVGAEEGRLVLVGIRSTDERQLVDGDLAGDVAAAG